jgi:hypothetical protein
VRPSAQPIKDWAASGVVILGEDGAQRPGIQLSWDGDQADIDAVLWQVRLASSGVVVHEGNTNNVAAGAAIITQSLNRNTAYQARGRYLALSGRDMLWSGWLSVTTPNVQLGYYDLNAANRVDALRSQMEALAESVRQLAKVASNDQVVTANDMREVRVEREAGDALVTAAFTEVITATVTGEGGLAERTATLEATVNTPVTGLSAKITSQGTTLATLGSTVGTLAETVNSVEAKTDAGTADGNVRFSAMSAPTGVAALYEMQISATGPSGTFVTAGEQYFVATDGTSYKRTNAKIAEWGYYDVGGVWQRGMYFDAVKARLAVDKLFVSTQAIIPGGMTKKAVLGFSSANVYWSGAPQTPTSPDIKLAGEGLNSLLWTDFTTLSLALPDKSADDTDGYLIRIDLSTDFTVACGNANSSTTAYVRIRRSGVQITRTIQLATASVGSGGGTVSATGGDETHVVEVVPNTGGTYAYTLQIGVQSSGTGNSFRTSSFANLHFSLESIIK